MRQIVTFAIHLILPDSVIFRERDGRFAANIGHVELLSADERPVASQAATACDVHASCRDSRWGLAVVTTPGQTVHPSQAAGDWYSSAVNAPHQRILASLWGANRLSLPAV